MLNSILSLGGSLVLGVVAVSAADPAPANPLDLNTIISGGTGATIIGAAYLLIKGVLDRALPSRSDTRASMQLVLEGLNNTVTILQAEKKADAAALQRKQERIDELEAAADVDYDRIRDLREEVMDLQTRLAQKDRHIATLIRELRKLGSIVTGVDLDDIEVTHSSEEVRRLRQEIPELNSPETGPQRQVPPSQ